MSRATAHNGVALQGKKMPCNYDGRQTIPPKDCILVEVIPVLTQCAFQRKKPHDGSVESR